MAELSEKDPNLGRTIEGKYRIDARLGQGAMGVVYRGLQLSVKRPVAIKLMAAAGPRHGAMVERFRREARAMAHLTHVNSVRLFEFGVTAQQELYIVMELLEGCDLSQLLHGGKGMAIGDALSVARQVVLALSEAHASGIVHRDLKPSNVFIARGQREVAVKVLDFGIAGWMEAEGAARLTRSGAVVGTPAYMSPEQARAEQVDARSDLYSLGVMLFEMLTGRVPFGATTTVDLLLAHAGDSPPQLASLRSELRQHPELQALVNRLLAKNREARPASATDLIESIDTIGAGLARPRARQPSQQPLPRVYAESPELPLWLAMGIAVIVIWIPISFFGFLPAVERLSSPQGDFGGEPSSTVRTLIYNEVPDAVLLVNGEPRDVLPTGQSPLVLELAPGRYRFEALARGRIAAFSVEEALPTIGLHVWLRPAGARGQGETAPPP